MTQIHQRLATELGVRIEQVNGAVGLLDEGATVPFIARYRKEVTGELDDSQLRQLEERLAYLRELEDRRATVIASIDEQEKLTPELKKQLLEADTKTRLEDLYAPYKPKRRTKGQMAIEAGLEPLADALYQDPTLDPEREAAVYVNADQGVEDSKAALDGARYILMERFAEDAELLEQLRHKVREQGVLSVSVVEGKQSEGEKFRDYFDYQEPLKKVPSHRMLAVLRGRNEGVLRLEIVVGDGEGTSPCEALVARHVAIEDKGRAADAWLAQVASWTWKIKLAYQMESELIGEKRQEAETEAIQVFANNLKDLLLAAPAGPRVTLGLDPGYRTGVKMAVVDATGRVLDHGAIFPHPPQKQWDAALSTLGTLCHKHGVELIAIGNGTASRETDKLAQELLRQRPELKMHKIVVSEAGASVYSASDLAAREFPDLDVTIRGAISIARRLQDPLAELVKIDPKAIGVGQYQHDVNQVQMAKSLDVVVEDCVNGVGVDLNTASAPLLTRVSGLSASVASNIIDYREAKGPFKNRQELLSVPRLGPKMFEQAAGFLRIMNGDEALDRSSVHPESYQIVERIAQDSGRDVKSLIGDVAFLRKVDVAQYRGESVGELTLKDILKELEKPGRDPRPEFKTAEFKDGVEKLSDLKDDMILEGVVTNVTHFGAFVDVGVHQDGLVHISAMSHEFVKDPRDVVKAGEVVKVKVMAVDVARKRIGLSMRLDDVAAEQGEAPSASRRPADKGRSQKSNRQRTKSQGRSSQQSRGSGAMADALKAALKQ
ncbi:RNA binding S1 domain protein [gamma proteobacterium HTCC5015]|nr:RNA binding S1 domain protein [gamma proteobacterium HTCC5015]